MPKDRPKVGVEELRDLRADALALSLESIERRLHIVRCHAECLSAEQEAFDGDRALMELEVRVAPHHLELMLELQLELELESDLEFDFEPELQQKVFLNHVMFHPVGDCISAYH